MNRTFTLSTVYQELFKMRHLLWMNRSDKIVLNSWEIFDLLKLTRLKLQPFKQISQFVTINRLFQPYCTRTNLIICHYRQHKRENNSTTTMNILFLTSQMKPKTLLLKEKLLKVTKNKVNMPQKINLTSFNSSNLIISSASE
jgi:hypothetical protein